MFPNSDEEVITALVDELRRCEHPITVVLRPLSAFHLAALLQLALRHPSVSADSRQVALTFIAHVREYFADAEAATVVEAMHRGDDPAFDRVRDTEPLMRLYHRTLGGHVHCRLFAGDLSPALSGTLVFSIEEWPTVRDAFARAPWLDIIDEATVL